MFYEPANTNGDAILRATWRTGTAFAVDFIREALWPESFLSSCTRVYGVECIGLFAGRLYVLDIVGDSDFSKWGSHFFALCGRKLGSFVRLKIR